MLPTNESLLHVLTREGVLINVSIRYWRGCKKLKAEDLGLNPEDVSDRLISLGHKRLLPKDALSELSLIEGRAHSLIDTNTFPFLNGLAHFLPNAKLEEVNGKLRPLETEFWQAKEKFLKGYGRHRDQAMGEWREMAKKLSVDPDRLVATITAAFPNPAQMEKHYGFDVTLFQIAVPERLEMDLVTLADQQQIMEARHQAAHQAGAKIRHDTEQFVAECVATLREQTAQLCHEMLQSIDSGKTDGVHQKTLNRLARFIDQFKQMNFANDTMMEQQLEQVRKELLSRTAEEYRDSSHAQKQLVKGLTALADKAKELARADTTEIVQRFGQIGKRKFNLAA
ncbi:MAG: hypothetical protein QOE70_3836 [Chthoniobacter sp.]|jgi:hypothetical protein|nr:hypothetical protein [Chthoniobacter sp.]